MPRKKKPKQAMQKPPKPAPERPDMEREKDNRKSRRRSNDAETRMFAQYQHIKGKGHDSNHPDAADARAIRLQHAWMLVVRKGYSIPRAAAATGLAYSTLRYHASSKGWLKARTEYQELRQEATHSNDVLVRALAAKRLTLKHVEHCRDRLDLMERTLHRKWLATLADTEEVDITDHEGKPQRIRVPKATPAQLSQLLDLHGKLLNQLNTLTKISDASLLRDLRRLTRSRRRVAHKVSARQLELPALAPVQLPGDKE